MTRRAKSTHVNRKKRLNKKESQNNSNSKKSGKSSKKLSEKQPEMSPAQEEFLNNHVSGVPIF